MHNKNTNEILKEVEVKKELLKPKVDVVFQSLFNQKNEEITKSFISDLLEENITSIKINETKELFRERPEDKLGILDLEAEINNCEKVDIEVQLIDRKNLVERMLFYFSKLYLLDVNKGQDYTNSKRVVIIAIIDYDMDITRKIEKMETIWSLREKNNEKMILTDKIELRIIELKKAKNTYNENRENRKAQWMLFLDDPNAKGVQDIMKKNEEIKKATIEVVKMTEDEKLQRLADLRLKAIMDEKAIYAAGLDKGFKQGREQAEMQTKLNVAKKMLKKNKPIEEIIDITRTKQKKD